jgi:hypothetical protein
MAEGSCPLKKKKKSNPSHNEILKIARGFLYNKSNAMQSPDFNFKDIVQHKHFDCEHDKFWAIVDACIDAMEEGTLPVTAQGSRSDHYLWETYILSVDQWTRICALLQRHRLPPRLFWRCSGVHSVAYYILSGRYVVDINPATIAAFSQMDYLWQDLDVVDVWIQRQQTSRATTDIARIHWVQSEVVRRRQWLTGLRATWLRALVVG